MCHKQGAIKAIRFYFIRFAIATIILGIFITAGCNDPQAPGFAESLKENQSSLQVIQTTPEDDAQNVELNTYIQAIFNTHLDPESIHESTLIIHEDTVLVEGSLVYNDSTISFFPAEELKINTRITASISSEIVDSLGNSMSQDFEWSFTTREATTQEIIPPAVASTEPSPGTTEVSADINIHAYFNKALNPSTVNNNTFLVRTNNTSVSGSVSYEDSVATFNPSENLQDGIVYTATITDGIRDTYGNAPNNNYNWNFITKDVDRTPPHVASTNPRDDEDDVSFDIRISATFSEKLDPATVNNNTFRLRSNNGSISGSVSYQDSTAVFSPSENLRDGTIFTATIINDIEDLSGNSPKNNYNWNFTTKEVDRTPPRVVSTDPRDDEDDVPVDSRITVTFTEPMDSSTLNEETFGLYLQRWGQYRQVSGSVSYSGTTATFNPRGKLRDDRDYVAIISSDVTDLAGNELGKSYRWEFETEDD
jgi:hypothetical protein